MTLLAESGRPFRYAVCLEETLGHRAHGLNLRAALARSAVDADVISVAPGEGHRLPWALSGSTAACRALRGRGRYDAVFFHTQTVALLAPAAVRGAPYVVSVDATPVQIDAMARWYEHRTGSTLAERLKRRWYHEVLGRAAGVVTWSQWALRSIESDYDVSPPRSLVAHPGAGPAFFEAGRRRAAPDGRPRILFVGGQFRRKGGETLLAAFEAVRDRADLVLVTEEEVPPAPGVTVRRGIRPGTPELHQAFAEADIFCLPTLGDCTPVALGEAMATGLPVITTSVGSNPEWVPASAGLIVPPADVDALAEALTRLVDDHACRRRLSEGALGHAEAHMDAERNAGRILALLEDVAAGRRPVAAR